MHIPRVCCADSTPGAAVECELAPKAAAAACTPRSCGGAAAQAAASRRHVCSVATPLHASSERSCSAAPRRRSSNAALMPPARLCAPSARAFPTQHGTRCQLGERIGTARATARALTWRCGGSGGGTTCPRACVFARALAVQNLGSRERADVSQHPRPRLPAACVVAAWTRSARRRRVACARSPATSLPTAAPRQGRPRSRAPRRRQPRHCRMRRRPACPRHTHGCGLERADAASRRARDCTCAGTRAGVSRAR